jgi:hypothetical protein
LQTNVQSIRIRSRKQEIGNRKQEIGSRKQETGNRKQDIRYRANFYFSEVYNILLILSYYL